MEVSGATRSAIPTDSGVANPTVGFGVDIQPIASSDARALSVASPEHVTPSIVEVGST